MVPAAAARQVLLITPADQPPMRPPNVRAAQRNDLRRLLVWCVVLGACAVCLLLGYVWVRLMVVEAGYRLSVTRQLVEALEREERELAVRAAAADSATQLEAAASARLGMRRPLRGEEEILP
ncbi:MAG: cell division protein FtsL [Deltaproteobacteria bacterium]|nr:cell division protein FtsL [Deltaproteobacteria bacterium]